MWLPPPAAALVPLPLQAACPGRAAGLAEFIAGPVGVRFIGSGVVAGKTEEAGRIPVQRATGIGGRVGARGGGCKVFSTCLTSWKLADLLFDQLPRFLSGGGHKRRLGHLCRLDTLGSAGAAGGLNSALSLSLSLFGCGLDCISLPVATFERPDRGLGHVGWNRFVIVPRLDVGDAFCPLRRWSLSEYEGLATEIC